ncbi:unnamed protein product [Camellia sinensis]
MQTIQKQKKREYRALGVQQKLKMRLWKRASGALKDRNSILAASLSRRTSLRNPDIEAAVIKATSHDESHVDYRNAQRVFAWIRMSPAYLRPFVWALSMRMEKTRSWAVVLKGLMLMHGVFCCKVPAVQKIGRLPFDLSNFKDGHASPAKMWGFNAFVRAYYAFLDQKSAFLCMDFQERKARIKEALEDPHQHQHQYQQQQQPIVQELVRLQKMQSLLDMLLQIKPQADGMVRFLILEAMDCIIIEIYDVYSRTCSGIAKVLMRIHSAGKVEASMALKVLQKATAQGEDLALYFEFCKQIGVINASECPKVEQVPEEDIRQLECIIGVSKAQQEDHYNDKAIVVAADKEIIAVHEEKRDLKSNLALQTIITNNWEVFDEDLIRFNGDSGSRTPIKEDPFAACLITVDHPYYVNGNHQELPDLISFS